MINYDLLDRLREKKPVIHHITNLTTINDLANIVLSWGAAPVMANSIQEVEEVVQKSDSLVLNTGMLSDPQFEAMLKAGITANKKAIPIILDPVGMGLSSFRSKKIRELLNNIKPQVIKGNSAEIINLSGANANLKGIESAGNNSNLLERAKITAQKYNCIVVTTGKEDLITDGLVSYSVMNSSPLMKNIIGTGCMTASTLACFLAIHSNPLEACINGLLAYKIAAENASKRLDVRGPGTFKSALFDEVFNLHVNSLKTNAKIRKVT